jgi:crotonobetainyl-CoA:carnitine CoA-transferase CaiB-like acyl-CoA transferase
MKDTVRRARVGVKRAPPTATLDSAGLTSEIETERTDNHPYRGGTGGDMTVDGASGPLDGLLVADFSRILAGPYATMLLADLGATVIKVEGPGGDDTRSWSPPVRDGVSTYYLGVNRGKRSIALDLRDESDAALARELARRADVLIENFKPGGLRKYGLDFESVRPANPRVVYASISGFGAGPGATVPGYDLMVQAISGLMSLTGDPDGPPYRAGISVFDVMAGNHAVIGILAALRHRDRTGEGQLVELNLLSSALSGLVNHSSAYVAGDVIPYRMGNAHPSVFPYEPLPTADNELIVTAGNDSQFRKLCAVLGVPEIADDSRFARNEDRTANRDELRPILVERLAAHGATEWFDLLVEAGVPSGPINTIDGGFAMAERFGLDPVVEAGEGARAVPTTRNPIRFSATAATYRLPPPELDEHGAELRTWLSTPSEDDDA